MPHLLSQLDKQARTAICSQCGPVAVRSKGPRRAGGPDRFGCAQRMNENARRNYRTKVRHPARRYDITSSEWDAMFLAQEGRCLICLDELTRPHTDHDHLTGLVRGLLCARCNIGLGYFADDPERLRAAATYLEG